MKVKFFKDNFNGRFTWSWVNGEYVTEDSAEIENYIALGIRHEEVKRVVKTAPTAPDSISKDEAKDAVKTVKERKKRQTKKAD